jgi:large subunit ribosomal protein L21
MADAAMAARRLSPIAPADPLAGRQSLTVLRTRLYTLDLFRAGGPMYAVIRTGGKQYRVSAGQSVRVEKLDAETGAEVVLSDVLLIGQGDDITIGAPLVSGAAVKATVVSHGKGEKIRIFKMRRRKHYRKTQGHRQAYTEIRIDSIATSN